MILDVIENLHKYSALNKGFTDAIEFLLRPDLRNLTLGKYEIDGERVYAMVSKDAGRRKEDASLETHEKYIDIQLVLDGTDNIGWKPKSLCKKPTSTYNEGEDIQYFADEPDSWIATKSGSFVIFFPEDAHMPLISSGPPLHKVIVKIAVAQSA